MALSLGSSKKVQDIQKKLDMSLDDLIASKRAAPKVAGSGAGGKNKKAPKSLAATRPATAKRNAAAIGIAAKKLNIKAKKAAGAALKGIAAGRAPLGVATRGVNKGALKTAGTFVKRAQRSAGGVQTTLAKRIVNRARVTAKQQGQPKAKQAPKAVPATKKKAKVPAPKFVAGAAKQQQQQPRKLAASAAGKIGQQRKQQQQQQGRRAPKQLAQQPVQQRQNGRNLNRTIGGGVNKAPRQAIKYQASAPAAQQQGVRQQHRGQQARAPLYPQPTVPRNQRHRQQQQQVYPQQYAQQYPVQQQQGGGCRRAPLTTGAYSIAAPGLSAPYAAAFVNPTTGQYMAAQQPQQHGMGAAHVPPNASGAGQMFLDTTTGLQYWVPAHIKDPTAYVARLQREQGVNAWAATQSTLRGLKQQRPAIARRGRA